MKTNPYYLKDTDGGYYNKYPEFAIYEEGKQAGIELEIEHSAELCARYIDDARKEVVEWVKQYHGLDFEEAKTQLKKWGIKQG